MMRLVGFILLFASLSAAAQVPAAAHAHRRELIREARVVWGLDAPVARFAAQVHQESGWNSNARSAYAAGLTQFTPSTARWIAQVYPRELGEAAPLSPRWALRGLVTYDRWLYLRIGATASECDHWAMTLSAYNGGLGWVHRDRRLASAKGADPAKWWSHTERYSHRAAWALRENRDYPRRILLRHEPRYVAAGWPGVSVCEVPG